MKINETVQDVQLKQHTQKKRSVLKIKYSNDRKVRQENAKKMLKEIRYIVFYDMQFFSFMYFMIIEINVSILCIL